LIVLILGIVTSNVNLVSLAETLFSPKMSQDEVTVLNTSKLTGEKEGSNELFSVQVSDKLSLLP